jgi:hypothetical protein
LSAFRDAMLLKHCIDKLDRQIARQIAQVAGQEDVVIVATGTCTLDDETLVRQRDLFSERILVDPLPTGSLAPVFALLTDAVGA